MMLLREPNHKALKRHVCHERKANDLMGCETGHRFPWAIGQNERKQQVEDELTR
jgi:hypothetical protein